MNDEEYEHKGDPSSYDQLPVDTTIMNESSSSNTDENVVNIVTPPSPEPLGRGHRGKNPSTCLKEFFQRSSNLISLSPTSPASSPEHISGPVYPISYFFIVITFQKNIICLSQH